MSLCQTKPPQYVSLGFKASCVPIGGGGPAASRPHGEPARDVQNPEHSRRNSGASGGDAADGVRRQRPDLHLHIPVDLQGLREHRGRPAAAAGQVGPGLEV